MINDSTRTPRGRLLVALVVLTGLFTLAGPLDGADAMLRKPTLPKLVEP